MAVTQQMLDEANAAFHRLALGEAVAEVRDQNGETVTYSRTNLRELRAYITWLEGQLTPSRRTEMGPMQVWM